jgi:hypothetical protein
VLARATEVPRVRLLRRLLAVTPAGGRPGQISRSYASTKRRGRCATYQAVCGKRATLLDNADRANRNPRRGLELNNGRNVKRSVIRAWGQYHSRILDRWAANTSRLEGATAEKAVPFPCAARRSVVLRLAELTCMTTSRGAKMNIDLDSWEAGYADGQYGRSPQCAIGLDQVSYLSGFCHGRARRAQSRTKSPSLLRSLVQRAGALR